ncbi:hypothetical protein CDL15_Pgr020644 [Punica granatum]|uniref:DNA ligase n=1 Tax=Punica granatum TaxID=22663 RepID=A0A218XHK6_PUNGR|nr:hypothetical protein CDL15_Pgr020644 [Punica granatum]
MSGDTKFSVLVSLFNWMQKSKSSAVKRSKFRKFLDTFCKPCDYFSAIRIILPSLDRERGTYGLKESVLATCLVDALGMSRDSEDAVRLFNWRRGGPKTGANAGNFAMVATEVLQRRQGTASGGLTINELNDLLDRLASAENRAEKTSVLSTLIKKTNAQEMKWIVMIILKDLKLGVSEKSIFHEFHPDAEDLFNVTCDLKLVCERLRDRSQRHKRQDIEVGKPVRPQLAVRVGNAATAWKKLHGKEVVVECKFDGDRIQIHKNGTEVHFFSRNFLDHSEYEHGMLDIIVQNILVDRCILDGEMLVWDKSLNHFAEFGSNQEIAKAAREGLDSDRQLCCILLHLNMDILDLIPEVFSPDVAFDILYSGDTSVIHQSLKERHELLRKVLKPIKGRLEILVPDGGLNTLREPCWSLIVHTLDDVERFFKETIENRDEGIVLKDLSSKWEPGDRSGKWLKLKPEYIRASSDLDVLIIGGYYGSGRRGGEVAQFLVGLAERPAPNSYPRRVGTGLTDDELDAVVTKLKPHFRKYEYPKKGPPSFYQVTNHSKERPDVWVESPEKSIILAITSDIRTISSEVFAAPYSLRFPRIDRVRWDKPWHECLDVQYFINVPSNLSLDALHKMVVENGGTFSMNLNNSVTHCIAAESKGLSATPPSAPYMYFLFLSDTSKRRLQEEIDEFSDCYYWDLDLEDIKQLLSNVKGSEDSRRIEYYKEKYCPKEKWSRFRGCSIHFLPSASALQPEQEILLKLVERRLGLEVHWGSGKVSKSLAGATHLVVLEVPGLAADLHTLTESLSAKEKRLLRKSNLHVVSSKWLEDCLESDRKLPEDPYNLHLVVTDESVDEEGQEDDVEDRSSDLASGEKPTVPPSLEQEDLSKRHEENAGDKGATTSGRETDVRRKSGRPPSASTKRERLSVTQARRTRPRLTKKGPKINEIVSDDENNSDTMDRDMTASRDTRDDGMITEIAAKTSEGKAVEDLESSHRRRSIIEGILEDIPATREEKPNEGCRRTEPEKEREEKGEENIDPKLEIMTDPVQAMLLDMIPSLGMMKKESTSQPSPSEEKAEREPGPRSAEGPTEELVVPKKKKVSYKDLAGELLKDW